MNKEIVHYAINQKELRKKNNTNGDFEVQCLCGNGNYHAYMTRNKPEVDCEACLKILESNPSYLKLRQK